MVSANPPPAPLSEEIIQKFNLDRVNAWDNALRAAQTQIRNGEQKREAGTHQSTLRDERSPITGRYTSRAQHRAAGAAMILEAEQEIIEARTVQSWINSMRTYLHQKAEQNPIIPMKTWVGPSGSESRFAVVTKNNEYLVLFFPDGRISESNLSNFRPEDQDLIRQQERIHSFEKLMQNLQPLHSNTEWTMLNGGSIRGNILLLETNYIFIRHFDGSSRAYPTQMFSEYNNLQKKLRRDFNARRINDQNLSIISKFGIIPSKLYIGLTEEFQELIAARIPKVNHSNTIAHFENHNREEHSIIGNEKTHTPASPSDPAQNPAIASKPMSQSQTKTPIHSIPTISSPSEQIENLTESLSSPLTDSEFLDERLLYLLKIIGVVIFFSSILVFIVASSRSYVVYFNKFDLVISALGPFAILASLIIYFLESDSRMFSDEHMGFLFQYIVSGVLFLGGIYCIAISFFNAIKHNRSIPMGVLIGLVKIFFSLIGVMLLLAALNEDKYKKKLTIIGFLVLVGLILINGQAVYRKKGWSLNPQNA